ncbi:MAG: hypothetical protein JOZ31_01010 [Verrucomicrobia bacterium]|nr:hypothetical protein [Verrucomicrobiota bacterium]
MHCDLPVAATLVKDLREVAGNSFVVRNVYVVVAARLHSAARNGLRLSDGGYKVASSCLASIRYASARPP